MLQQRAGMGADVLVTGRLCEIGITQSCSAADLNMGGWPCPSRKPEFEHTRHVRGAPAADRAGNLR